MPAPPRFAIRRSLGEGGFGFVYEAWDQATERRVALKQLRDADPAALLRFKREFRSLADVSHPNLVRLEELLHHDDQWFLTMELVDGVDLLTWVRPPADLAGGFRLPFDETRLRAAFGQLVDGIAALHRAGLLHRDLKPSNVLITREGRVVILDFGLVAHLAPGDLSRTTTIMGTPAYMSPEQVGGDPLGPASDSYSLGVMLFEALTGRLPFEGAFFAMMAARVQRVAPRPSQFVAGLPADLDELCAGLLALDPAARPGLDAIRATIGGSAGPVRATEERPVPAVPSFVGREREMAELRRGLERTRAGEAVVALIAGLSGMGKSTLAQHFLQEIRSDGDALVLSGRCYQRESVPYKALDSVVDGLGRWLLALPPLEAARYLPRDFAALHRLFPVLKAVAEATVGRRTAGEIPDAKELRRRGFAALRDLLGRLADDRTLVIHIDDLQWGDLDSGELLLELLQPPNPPPLLLLAAFRSDEAAASPLLQLLAQRRPADLPVVDIPVGELAPHETEALARLRLADRGAEAEAMARAVAREASGNPFLVEQLVEQAAAVPAAAGVTAAHSLRFEQMLATRLDALPREARRLLEVVAVAGRPLAPAVANRAAGLDPSEPGPLRDLEAGRWVRSRVSGGGPALEAYHDRIREGVVRLLAPEVLPAYHNRIAASLQAAGLADPELLSGHYLDAGDTELAARHALRAAELASEALAFDRAATLYRRAIEVGRLDPATLQETRVRLADALANAGLGAEAARVYQAAAVSASDGAAELRLMRLAAEQYLITGLVTDGLTALRAVQHRSGMRIPRSPFGALAGLVARRAVLRVRGFGFTPRRASEVPVDTLERLDICWSGAVGLGLIDPVRAAHLQALHMQFALAAGEPARVARALILELAFLSTAGSRTAARVEALRARCRTLVADVDDPYPRALLTVVEGNIANLAGRFAESHAHCVEAQLLLRERCTGVTWETELAQLYELHSLSHLGRWRELATRAPVILAHASERRNNLLATYIRTRILFLLRLADGEPDRAAEEQATSLATWTGTGFQLQHYWNWYASVLIDLYRDDLPGAWARLSDGWGPYRRSLMSGTEALHVGILAVRARVAAALARRERGRRRGRLLTTARRDARWLERTGLPWAVAYAAAARAACIGAEEGAAAAVGPLTVAAEALDRAGLAPEAAGTWWQVARHAGGTQGDRAREAALAWMQREGIREPDRLAAMYAPDFSVAA